MAASSDFSSLLNGYPWLDHQIVSLMFLRALQAAILKGYIAPILKWSYRV
ncbi:MAG: hypothetical protein H0U76_16985 [Ktedonobacteraceae bacterium]|nr:hypothetical protein [Ktedonobacteraceae bacterium]